MLTKTFIKEISPKEAIEAIVKVQKTNKEYYFSITGTMGEIHVGRPRDPLRLFGKVYDITCCCCIHEDIAKHFPAVAKFIPLHLSDIDGKPMYYIENSIWHAREGQKEILQKHLRISEWQATEIYETIRSMETEGQSRFKSNPDQIAYMHTETQKLFPEWKRQADELIAFIKGETRKS